MSIKLVGKIHSVNFYEELLPQISTYYKNWDKRTAPSLDFDDIEYIDPPVLPLLASLGLYLKQFHAKIGLNLLVNLKISNSPQTLKIIHFLDKSNFFSIVGNTRTLDYYSKPLNLFSFNEQAIGGYTGYDLKQTRLEHNLHVYFPLMRGVYDYHTLTPAQQSRFRDKLMEEFIIGRVREDYSCVLATDESFLRINNVEELIGIISEIIENGIVHSESEVFALVNSNKYRSILSVSDIGKGFEKSLNDKNSDEFVLEKFYILKYFSKNKYIKPFHTCYIIFDALLFSLNRDRKGLIDILLEFSSLEGGHMRIHNGDIQIVFSLRFSQFIRQISQIRIEILKEYDKKVVNKTFLNKLFKKGASLLIQLCDAVIETYSPDINISSLRKFNAIFPGVHIECELKNLNS